MDMENVIKSAAREAMRIPDATHVSEIRDILTGLNVGVRDVISAGQTYLRIVMDEGWEPLDGSWGSEDTAAAMFNAMELQGYRHVPGTSRFLSDGSTRFVKDGMAFDFAALEQGIGSPLQL